jgi:hypothetical protein
VNRNSISFVFIALLIVVGFFFYFTRDKSTETLLLKFSDGKKYTLDFEGSFSWFEARIAKESEGKFALKGCLECVSMTLNHGSSIRLRWKELSIYDTAQKRLILGFEKSSSEKIHYFTDSNWSDSERAHIYQAFNIDYNEESPFEDHSLLTESFSLNIHETGQILGIELSATLRNSLYQLIQKGVNPSIFWETITSPEKFPPLFSKTVSKKNQFWETTGKFMKTEHRRLSSDSFLWKIESEGESQSQEYILKWDYHSLLGSIPNFSLYWHLQSPGNQRKTIGDYNINFNCVITPH